MFRNKVVYDCVLGVDLELLVNGRQIKALGVDDTNNGIRAMMYFVS